MSDELATSIVKAAAILHKKEKRDEVTTTKYGIVTYKPNGIRGQYIRWTFGASVREESGEYDHPGWRDIVYVVHAINNMFELGYKARDEEVKSFVESVGAKPDKSHSLLFKRA